jgi:pimeloyl-ACP methyl ester carboxylesterase
MKPLRIPVAGDTTLSAIESGQGPTLLLLHGAIADERLWAPHQALLADAFRTIAPTQRWFGNDEWAGGGPRFGVDTHARDLVGVLEALGGAPAHLAAWSYAGHVALTVAARRPDLVASVFLYEPGVPVYVTDPAELEVWSTDAEAMFGPIVDALEAGDTLLAMRCLLDAAGQREGVFDRLPEAGRRMHADNARTLKLQLDQAPPPPLSPQDLAALPMPVTVLWGGASRPVFRTGARDPAPAARGGGRCRPPLARRRARRLRRRAAGLSRHRQGVVMLWVGEQVLVEPVWQTR